MEMAICYKDVLERVKRQLSAIMHSTWSLSPAFVRMVNGNKCEIYYAYNFVGKGAIYRPYIRLAVDYGSGTLLEFRNAYFAEFADAERFPLDMEINPAVPYAKTVQEQSALLEKLQSLYEKVREFAYEEALSSTQRELLNEYSHCLQRTVPRDLMDFFAAEEKDFFAWIHNSLT